MKDDNFNEIRLQVVLLGQELGINTHMGKEIIGSGIVI